ncbi:MAG: UDP-glucuronic acid decarboxylase family protein [Candidatus Dormibacteria bacterium]
MRVVLAGAAGFVGSHLAAELLSRGDEVVAVDNYLTGRPENIRALGESPGLSVVEHDITQPLHVTGPVDAVINLASPASPPDYMRHPLATLDAGTAGTRALLELAAEKAARFLLGSTSEVYGDPSVHPQPEEYWGNVNPVGPRSVYDEAKRCAEAYTMAYHRAGVDTRIARIFNTYGERMRPDDGRAIPNFIAQALRDSAVTVYGDGSQTRSLCYVSDLVDGLLRLLAGEESRPVNLGSQEEVTIRDLAERIIALTGAGHIVFRPLPEDDPQQRRPDTTRALESLAWSPKVSLVDGLQRTLRWFRTVV